jgi:asparagine synthetase B (glutamine-hydrolysing)
MSESGSRIELSQWHARLLTGDLGGPAGKDGEREDAVSIGPVTVFRPASGSEIATFGSNRRSGAIFDGYLFDRDALITDLGLRSDADATNAELVAAAYQHWGTDLFDKLDGRYLAAVWDDERQRLLLGHDALGRHPIYYSVATGAFFFATNILALASSGFVSTEPNRLSLALAALMYWPESGQTYFDRIRRCRPGHFLEVTARGDVSERKYWAPIPDDDEPWLRDDEAIEAFEPTLIEAVNRCLRMRAQGILLSGGVDSVAVATLAVDRSPPPSSKIVAVSARTGGPLTYEEEMQSAVAERLQMPHIIWNTPDWCFGRDRIQMSLDITAELPSPSRLAWVGSHIGFLRKVASQQLRTLLTGSGGDNWLGVADTHAADLIRGFRLLQLLQFVRADVATAGHSIGSAAGRLLWRGGLRPHLDSLWGRLAPSAKSRYHERAWLEQLPTWLCPDQPLKATLVHALLNRRTPSLTASGGIPRSYYRHSLRSAASPYVHYEFETAFHVETLAGVRLLSPYHDRKLVTFLNRISPRTLLHRGRYKGLLRPLVASRLPGLGLDAQRKRDPERAVFDLFLELQQSIGKAWPAERFTMLDRLGVVNAGSLVGEINRPADNQFEQLNRMFVLLGSERWLATRTRL